MVGEGTLGVSSSAARNVDVIVVSCVVIVNVMME